MSSKVQIRRGTQSNANSFAGAEGELYMNLNQNDLRLHDGTTPGGHRIPNSNFVLEVSNSKVDKINLPSPTTTVGSGSQIPVITYNDQGQITSTAIASLNIPSNIATESYVQTQISDLVNAAPAQLNTLNELALALNNDSSFAVTVNNAIAAKQNTLVSGTNIKTIGGQSIVGSGNLLIPASAPQVFHTKPSWSASVNSGNAVINTYTTFATLSFTAIETNHIIVDYFPPDVFWFANSGNLGLRLEVVGSQTRSHTQFVTNLASYGSSIGFYFNPFRLIVPVTAGSPITVNLKYFLQSVPSTGAYFNFPGNGSDMLLTYQYVSATSF